MNIGSIAGGTHSGWRKVKQAHPSWECSCREFDIEWHHTGHSLGKQKLNPGWRAECDDCLDERPT